MDDPFDLERFVHAQDADGNYARARAEMGTGAKVTHWMWFVFPQIAGLGRSTNAQTFAIRSRAEAEAYLRHPVLGRRLLESAQLLVSAPKSDAIEIFGTVDAQKLRSSMTLFMRVDPRQSLFGEVLAKYFGGLADPRTEDRLL